MFYGPAVQCPVIFTVFQLKFTYVLPSTADVTSTLTDGTVYVGCLQTCKKLIDRAFSACDTGIVKAQAQCLGVMGELGNVYHHARDVLDRINPERWAGARTQQQQQQQQQQQPDQRQKRQLPAGFGDIRPHQR